VAPPEVKLLVNLRISVVAFNEELCLLKVGEGPEGKVGRP